MAEEEAGLADPNRGGVLLKGDFSTGQINLPNTPYTSKGSYDILTRNDSTGAVETIAASSFLTQSLADTKYISLIATYVNPSWINSLDWAKITTGKPTTIAGYGITDAALDATVVHLTGDEFISGSKVFMNKIRIGGNISSPELLAVNGKIEAKGIKVVPAATWPDYVFAENYKLPSLTEIEQFIKANKHLPEIPSEQEVKRDGVELSDMNIKLLKKVEELTLYIINLEKRLNQLEQK